MPVAGFVSDGLVSLLTIIINSTNPVIRVISGFLLSALFLPMVLLGLHHGLIPIYAVQLEQMGGVSLFPVLSMGGAGQVGAAIAIYLVARKVGNKKMQGIITGALPAGFLGVGEPLIYGVTLPMGKPFITAGIGAGFGGAYIMFTQVMANAWGPSGLVAIPLMQGATGMLNFLIGLIIAYIGGFIVTKLWIKDSDVREEEENFETTNVEEKYTDQAVLYAPVTGSCIPLTEVKDEVFANKMMGDGVAFTFDGDTVVSPCDGTIVMIAATKHAIGIQGDDGVEVLIHVGLDTVSLNGEGFKASINQGDHVKKGEAILQIDHKLMKEKGMDLTTPMIITNTDQYHLAPTYNDSVIAGDTEVLKCNRK